MMPGGEGDTRLGANDSNATFVPSSEEVNEPVVASLAGTPAALDVSSVSAPVPAPATATELPRATIATSDERNQRYGGRIVPARNARRHISRALVRPAARALGSTRQPIDPRIPRLPHPVPVQTRANVSTRTSSVNVRKR